MTNRLMGDLLGAGAMALAMTIGGAVSAQDAVEPVVAAAIDTVPLGEA